MNKKRPIARSLRWEIEDRKLSRLEKYKDWIFFGTVSLMLLIIYLPIQPRVRERIAIPSGIVLFLSEFYYRKKMRDYRKLLFEDETMQELQNEIDSLEK